MKVTIQKVAYELQYKLRIFFVFESLAGYEFKFGKLIDEYLLFYATLLANNADFKLEFDKFIDECDNDPSLFASFKEFFTDAMKLQAQLYTPDGVKKKIAQA